MEGLRARVGAAPASATQRAENAGLPLDRADVDSRAAVAKRGFRRQVMAPSPGHRSVRRHLVGEVTDIARDRMTFEASLFEDGRLIHEAITLPMALVAEGSRPAITSGTKFDYLVRAGSDGQGVELRFATAVDRAQGSDARMTIEELVYLLNSGAIRAEIDAAVGDDPDLAI